MASTTIKQLASKHSKLILLLSYLTIILAGCDFESGSTFSSSTPPTAQAQLDQLIPQIPALRTRLDTLAANGVDVAYPLVCLTVLEQLSTILQSELDAGISSTLLRQVYELADIRDSCDAELSQLETGILNPEVPRYVTSDITIQNSAFTATVEWNDGTQESWPVIFSGFGHFDQVVADIELMPDYGCNIIQVEIGPSWILTEEDTTDDTEINRLVGILDRAEAANVAVNVLLSPHYFPEWAFDKWPDIKKDNKIDEYSKFFVDASNTNARNIIEEYLEILIPRIKDHPALHSLTLENEPSYFNGVGDSSTGSDVYNRNSYNAWLTTEYGNAAGVSSAHGEAYSSLDDVPSFYTTSTWELQPAGSIIQIYDYHRFNDKRFSGFFDWMAGEIRTMTTDVPLHVKITDMSWSEPYEGVDPEMFTELSDIAGNDSAKYYAGYDSTMVEVNDYLRQNIFFDLLRSSGNGKPIFNSENHVVPDDDARTVPELHFRNILWQAAIHGEGASTTWLWEREVYDETNKVYTKASIMNRPKAVVEMGKTGLDLLRLGKEVNAFQQAPARVAFVYSAASLVYNNTDYFAALFMGYEALNNTGEKIDFLTEAQLENGDAANYEMVVAFEVSHMPQTAYTGLQNNPPTGQLVLIGSNNFKKDSLNQTFNFTPPAGTSTLTRVDEAYKIREDIIPLLENLSGGRPVTVMTTDSEPDDAFGVEWRTVVYNGNRLVNLTNYNKSDMTVTISGLATSGRTDLITQESVGSTVTIAPMQTYLLSAAE